MEVAHQHVLTIRAVSHVDVLPIRSMCMAMILSALVGTRNKYFKCHLLTLQRTCNSSATLVDYIPIIVEFLNYCTKL